MTQHAERRVLAHKPEHLYALVADVAKYPEFLPWCLASRIRCHEDDKLVADLIIGFQMFKERFTSHVRLDEGAMTIHVEYAEGPFKYLKNTWVFLPHDKGCEIDFYVDFEFNSRILQTVIESLFTEAVKRMVSAFEARADVLYGTTATPSSRRRVISQAG